MAIKTIPVTIGIISAILSLVGLVIMPLVALNDNDKRQQTILGVMSGVFGAIFFALLFFYFSSFKEAYNNFMHPKPSSGNQSWANPRGRNWAQLGPRRVAPLKPEAIVPEFD